jgi:hypothetical protein
MSDDVYEMYDLIYELFLEEKNNEKVVENVIEFFDNKDECIKFVDFVCKNLVQ